VIAASREAAPDLWRRWLAVVLEGIALGARRTELPGHAPEPEQIERIISGDARASRAR
jgi:hypothetical protein